MSIIKMYENFISDKIDSLKKLQEFVDYINKYGLDYFIISAEDEDGNYMFEDIHKKNPNLYTLEYQKYETPNNTSNSKYLKENIMDLPEDMVDKLYKTSIDEGRFDIECQLSYNVHDVDQFMNILRAHKEKIDFQFDMFDSFEKKGDHEKINSFEFQDVLFTTHPESYKVFINLSFYEQDKYDDIKTIKLHPKVLTKYKSLLGKYYKEKELEKESKKFNL